MRLKSIDIRGMNKVVQHTYTFDNDIVYLNGKMVLVNLLC